MPERRAGPDLVEVVQELGSRLGLRAAVHAVDLDTGRETGVEATTPVVAASVFKVPVLLELCLQAEAGEHDLRAPVVVPAGHRPTLGSTGLSVVSDDTTLSLRDLALSMMSVSDNRATDLVLDRVGVDRVNRRLEELGLPGTWLVGDCQTLWDHLAEDVGRPLEEIGAVRPGPEVAALVRASRLLDPARTSRTTAAETTALLRRVWDADGLPEAACAEVRRVMGLQVWPHRLRSGFADVEARLAGKTGTMWFVRNEAGVVTFADGGRYAVAVFLLLDDPGAVQPDADRAIGTLGRAAVDALRAG